MVALGLGGRGFNPGPNPSSDSLSISLLISETLHINNKSRTRTPRSRIICRGHPDIINKVEKDVKPNQTKEKGSEFFTRFKLSLESVVVDENTNLLKC